MTMSHEDCMQLCVYFHFVRFCKSCHFTVSKCRKSAVPNIFIAQTCKKPYFTLQHLLKETKY